MQGKKPTTTGVKLTSYKDDLKLPHLVKPLSPDRKSEDNRTCHICSKVVGDDKVPCCREQALSTTTSAVRVCHECLPLVDPLLTPHRHSLGPRDAISWKIERGALDHEGKRKWMISTSVVAPEYTSRTPVDFVVVLDVSASGDQGKPKSSDRTKKRDGEGDSTTQGGASRFNFVRKAMLEVIQSDVLDDKDRLAIVTFSSTTQVLIPLTNVDRIRDTLEHRIESILYGGKTNTYAGIERGLDQFDDLSETRTKSLLLVMGWITTSGVTDTRSMCNLLASRPEAQGVTIDTIGHGTHHDAILLRELAVTCRGEYQYHSTADDFSEYLRKLWSSRKSVPIHDLRVMYWARANCTVHDTVGRVFPPLALGSLVVHSASTMSNGQIKDFSAGVSLDVPDRDGFVQLDVTGQIDGIPFHDRRFICIPHSISRPEDPNREDRKPERLAIKGKEPEKASKGKKK